MHARTRLRYSSGPFNFAVSDHAWALKDQGVEYMFGIVGLTVQPIARETRKGGIKYYGGG
jgi:hypothetical protein